MHAKRFKVVLDANVLFPFSLRDTLLRSAAESRYQLYWSETILDEMQRNLVAKGFTSGAQAARLRSAMIRAFPESTVTGFEALIASMLNDEKDRHVAAAAAQIGAETIVTFNLKDFRSLPAGVTAQGPDEFLCGLFDEDNPGMRKLIENQATALKRPPRSMSELLNGLSRMVPKFSERVRSQVK